MIAARGQEPYSSAVRAGVPALHIRPLLDADRRAAARIYVHGLIDEEVRPMMPHHEEAAEAVFAELIRPGACSWIAAANEGEVVGLALCQGHHGFLPNMVDWRVLSGHLPLAAAIRAWIISLYLYKASCADGELYLQSLAVAGSWQRRGVGGALVTHVCEEAHRHGYRKVTLNVVDRNVGARRLYERLGFAWVHTTRTGFLKPFVGFDAMDRMEKRLASQPERVSAPQSKGI
jgi:ribosomal protein S18 acetylase RimI-like enzyme